MEFESIIVKVPCVLTDENKLIPCWDASVKYECESPDGFLGSYYVNGSFVRKVTGYMNVSTKEIFPGKLIEIKEGKKERHEGFKPGTDVVVEADRYNQVRIDKVVDVIYEDENYDVTIGKGINVKEYTNIPEDIEINDDEYYEVRTYKTVWVLESGQKIYWSHKLKILVK